MLTYNRFSMVGKIKFLADTRKMFVKCINTKLHLCVCALLSFDLKHVITSKFTRLERFILASTHEERKPTLVCIYRGSRVRCIISFVWFMD